MSPYALLCMERVSLKILLNALCIGALALRSTLFSTLMLFSEVQLPYTGPGVLLNHQLNVSLFSRYNFCWVSRESIDIFPK